MCSPQVDGESLLLGDAQLACPSDQPDALYLSISRICIVRMYFSMTKVQSHESASLPVSDGWYMHCTTNSPSRPLTPANHA